MAQFKNNDFGHDSNAEHTLRCELFVSGAAVHGVELAFRGTLEADITAHVTTWKALEIQHEDEKGDVLGATALIESLQGELEDFIVAGRYLVNSMLLEEDVVGIIEHDIRKDFGVRGKIPDGASGMIDLGRQMAAINVKYIADLSPYALPPAPFENIGTKAEELQVSIDTRKTEHTEQIHVGKLKEIERAKGDRLLSRAFNWTVAVWGVDDPRLEEMGFVPKSQIWTPGQPEPGERTFPEAFEDVVVNYQSEPSPMNILGWTQYSDCDFGRAYREKALIGEGVPDRPGTPWQDDVTENPLADTEVEPGYAYYYWVCAVKDDVEGEFVMVMVEYPA